MLRHPPLKAVWLTLIILLIAIVGWCLSIVNFPNFEYQNPVVYADLQPVFHQPNPVHITTPQPVRALYLTSWVAGSPVLRQRIIDLVDKTEINAVVIDIKDYTGRIAFAVSDPLLQSIGSAENRIPDIQEFLTDLHQRQVYVIGRISVFQDLFLAARRPDLAARRADNNEVWRDRKGIAWLDPGSEEVWQYVVAIGKQAWNLGFDELNFDYIRFPSDGDMRNINYPLASTTAPETRVQVLGRFFAYLDQELSVIPAPLSADLFGLATVNRDDLGIGQVLEQVAPHFDFIAPMVYPSHYAPGFLGFSNPATKPYEVVSYSVAEAGRRLIAASSTAAKLRPWLQDFDLGANYDSQLVRAQMQAVYDNGLSSWMLWDPANKYTSNALELNISF